MLANANVWPLLLGFIVWLVFLYLWWRIRAELYASDVFSVPIELSAWKQDVAEAKKTGEVGAFVFAVLARPFLVVAKILLKWPSKAIDLAVIGAGPLGLSAIASASGLWDNVPPIIREIRLFFHDVVTSASKGDGAIDTGE